MDTFQILYIVGGALITLLLLYLVIRIAVSDATVKLRGDLNVLINLKREELKRQGATEAEIRDIISKTIQQFY